MLQTITIENFKNCQRAELSFAGRMIGFAGLNGAGKTNLLDAIYFLSAGKSYFNAADTQLIREEESYFSLKGTFLQNEKEEDVLCVLMRGRRKVIKRNGIPYTRLLDHYGEFPAVMVSPGDVELITGGSEERRRWLDSTRSLHDRDYLLQLMRYEKILEQRNAELRRMEADASAEQLLEVYDSMLAPLGQEIYEKRKAFLSDFHDVFQRYHIAISGEREHVQLLYESRLAERPMDELLRSAHKKDVLLQRTTAGIHRDDLLFQMEGNLLKRHGSQGQQKTFLLALKLAQHQYTKEKKGFAPMLLLDDVCERLDEGRLETLFDLIRDPAFGQVFVTDSSMQRLQHYLRQYARNEKRIFLVESGNAHVLDE